MFSKLPFYIGNFVACFVVGSDRRSHVRGAINIFLYMPAIKRLLRRYVSEQVKTVRFVRQRTLNRVVCIINNRWYVKIFRKVTNEQLKNYAVLNDYIVPYISVNIPKIMVDNRLSMYMCDTVVGKSIKNFSKHQILNNSNKIQQQVFKLIDELQNIDIMKIPNYKSYEKSLQPHREEIITEPTKVLAHFDLNAGNLLFDDDMNIISVIDWDAVAIAHSKDTDRLRFLKCWDRFLKSL